MSASPGVPLATRPALAQVPLAHRFSGLPGALHRRARIQPLAGAHTIHVNVPIVELLGLAKPDRRERDDYARYFGGEQELPHAQAVASAYAGHQFGIFVPQLGDGRALLLGEVLASDGQYYDLCVKGAGPNDFSRGGDGRAVLRSTIREYLCGEAMNALGIASTRGLAIIGSDTPVQRETLESAAILVRVARTHIRFGHFEYLHYRGEHDSLRQLADFVLEHYYPDAVGTSEPYVELYRRAIRETAIMIADWQAYGFVHGVMNTDNMSILGDTLDYGPFGFMETFDPQWVCNHSDARGRYAWHRQPAVGLWNLAALGQSLSSLIPEEAIKKSLGEYGATLNERWILRMCARMGLDANRDTDTTVEIINEWLDMLAKQSRDYHLSFRDLCALAAGADASSPEVCSACPREDERFAPWLKRYRGQLAHHDDPEERRARMERSNPLYVLRKHLAHQAIIQAEKGDYGELDKLLQLVCSPCREVPGSEPYAETAPEWAEKIELSCSS